uniref:COP9 signalosome subunit 7B n=1 Tax=Sinocyclocheilus grahami TaxID=75366 RepID=A0A672M5Z1_SINGR
MEVDQLLSLSGSALVQAISSLLETPGLYVFSDILELPNVRECLPYSLLLQQLELKNVRELEDLLIEAVYSDIIHGKLDQRNQQVEVDCSIGRDLGPNELPNIANTLQEWCAGCEAVLCGIEEQVSRANQYRESQLKVKVQVETEVCRSYANIFACMMLQIPQYPTSHLSLIK